MFKIAEFKKASFFILIGSLIAAALVAVITVLVGQFNEITGRVFITLFLAVAHSLVSLLFIWDDSRRNTFTKLAFFINTIFLLIVVSFFTSIFGVWKIVSAENVAHLYQTYFLIAFASLHADILSKATKKEKYLDGLVYANYIFIGIVVLMLQPVIYMQNAFVVLGQMYFRFLAAAAIVDGTLSVLIIIFFKFYMHKHPELKVIPDAEQNKKRGLSIWIWLLIIYLLFQIGMPLIMVFSWAISGFSKNF